MLICMDKKGDGFFEAKEVKAVARLKRKENELLTDTFVFVTGFNNPFRSDYTPAETARCINEAQHGNPFSPNEEFCTTPAQS